MRKLPPRPRTLSFVPFATAAVIGFGLALGGAVSTPAYSQSGVKKSLDLNKLGSDKKSGVETEALPSPSKDGALTPQQPQVKKPIPKEAQAPKPGEGARSVTGGSSRLIGGSSGSDNTEKSSGSKPASTMSADEPKQPEKTMADTKTKEEPAEKPASAKTSKPATKKVVKKKRTTRRVAKRPPDSPARNEGATRPVPAKFGTFKVKNPAGFKLGAKAYLGQTRDPASMARDKNCIRKSRGRVYLCVENADWPTDGLDTTFTTNSLLYEGRKVVVRYNQGTAEQVFALFNAQKFDQVMRHYRRSLGTLPYGVADHHFKDFRGKDRIGYIAQWRGVPAGQNQDVVLIVRQFDDTRKGYPDTAVGIVQMYYSKEEDKTVYTVAEEIDFQPSTPPQGVSRGLQ